MTAEEAVTSREEAPFGAYPPSPFQNWARARAGAMPDTWAGKRAAMLLRRIAGTKTGRPFDVAVFDAARARLHPYDNNSEKRVYATPQFWDAAERAVLAEAIGSEAKDAFLFADIGANAGLYTLFAICAARNAGRPLQVVALEPEPTVRARLTFNLKASNAEDAVTVLPWAATDVARQLTFAVDTKNRGENKIVSENAADALTVEGRPLADAFNAAGFSHVDAMKIDIEGAEAPALAALFDEKHKALWPRMIIMETFHDKGADSALRLCLHHGYEIALQTKLNSILQQQGL